MVNSFQNEKFLIFTRHTADFGTIQSLPFRKKKKTLQKGPQNGHFKYEKSIFCDFLIQKGIQKQQF